MPNRLLLAASRSKRIGRFIRSNRTSQAVANRFVPGDSIDEALKVGNALHSRGIGTVLDYLGEHVESEAQADNAAESYLSALKAIELESPAFHVSIKLTQLGLVLDPRECLARVRRVCDAAKSAGTQVEIDMESHEFTGPTIHLYRALREDFENVLICLQAYLRRTRDDLESLSDFAPRIRLCKGAYDEPRAIAFDPDATNDNYIKLLELLASTASFVAVATHHDFLIDHAKKLNFKGMEFQMLYGVRRNLQSELVSQGHKVRVYVPYGEQWYPYLMRRLAERPANVKFFLRALLRR